MSESTCRILPASEKISDSFMEGSINRNFTNILNKENINDAKAACNVALSRKC